MLQVKAIFFHPKPPKYNINATFWVIYMRCMHESMHACVSRRGYCAMHLLRTWMVDRPEFYLLIHNIFHKSSNIIARYTCIKIFKSSQVFVLLWAPFPVCVCERQRELWVPFGPAPPMFGVVVLQISDSQKLMIGVTLMDREDWNIKMPPWEAKNLRSKFWGAAWRARMLTSVS